MRRALPAAIVAATAVTAYAATLNNFFVQDDFGVVWLLSQKPAGYFPTWFVTSWMDTIWGYTPDEVRPFVALTYQVAALLGPGTAWPNHAINVALHAGTGLLVWRTAREAAGLGSTAATLAGVIFVLLPNQAETAAWITGRVDSMPAFFYLAAFLAWVRWRRSGRPAAYAWSIVWCLVALFSKQNTITLVASLLLYDWMVERSLPRWRAYAPHGALTAGYLALRYGIFGEVAREGQFTSARIGYFLQDAADHVVRLVFGNASPAEAAAWGVAAVALLLAAAHLSRRDRSPQSGGAAWRSAVYFGPVWISVGLLPTLMSTYSSTRHAYLAAAGWAILAALGMESGLRAGTRRARVCAGAAAALLLVVYGVQLQALVREWDVRASVAAQAVSDLEREARGAAPGTLILVGAPGRSMGFALPFAVQPPFTDVDLPRHVRLLFHSSLYCCPANIWEPYSRDTLAAWLADPSQPPAVALYWNADSGRLSRISTADDPSLRTLFLLLGETETRAALDANITRVLDDYVAVR